DFLVLELLPQVDFERTIWDEDYVLAEQTLLDAVIENLGKQIELQDGIDAAAPHRPVAHGKVSFIGKLSAFGGDDQVTKPLRSRAIRDLERRMAADGTQRQLRAIVAGQHARELLRRHGAVIRRESCRPCDAIQSESRSLPRRCPRARPPKRRSARPLTEPAQR